MLVQTFLLALIIFGFSPLGWSYDPKEGTPMLAHETPEALEGVGVEEKLGQRAAIEVPFVDEQGDPATIGQFLKDGRPVVLSIVYYGCPGLCNYHLNGITDVVGKTKLDIGKDYHFVAVSMNHREGPTLASSKKKSHMKELGIKGAEKGWHFLTGTEENIKKVTDSIGFNFRWSEAEQQYAHAATATILTPNGQISRYLYGIEFDPKTFKLAILEGSEGKVGSVVDRLVSICFKFDPLKKKYSLHSFNLVRLAGILTVIVLAVFLIPVWLRDRRRRKTSA